MKSIGKLQVMELSVLLEQKKDHWLQLIIIIYIRLGKQIKYLRKLMLADAPL